MSVVAAAIITGAVVGYAGSKGGAKAQAKGAERGAEVELQMSQENIAFQKEMTEQQREDFAPWRDVGQNALDQIWSDVESGAYDPGDYEPGDEFDPGDEFKGGGKFAPGARFNPEKFDPSKINLEQDPGYQFRVKEGIKALDRSASARGKLRSGAQDKAITRYGQEAASQEYANAYSRFADKYSRNYQRESDIYRTDYQREADIYNTGYQQDKDVYDRGVDRSLNIYQTGVNRASDIYSKEADRKARKFNILSGISGLGQASAAGQAGASGQLASTVGNIYSNVGRSQNVAQQNIGGAKAGGYYDTANVINQAAQNWLTYKGAQANTPPPKPNVYSV